jgi:ORF6N domain
MEIQVIKNKIYEIRGHKVILDYDLAELYMVENKRLKEAVRRNLSRFPEDFLFELTKDEYVSLRSQIATLKNGRGKFSKYLPFAFTEQGVAMLASILHSETAIQVNIQIVRAFVFLRQYALNHEDLNDKLKLLESTFNQRFKDIDDAINYLLKKDKIKLDQSNRNKIGFNSDNKE